MLKREGDWSGLLREKRPLTGLLWPWLEDRLEGRSFFQKAPELGRVLEKFPDGEGEGGPNIGDGSVESVRHEALSSSECSSLSAVTGTQRPSFCKLIEDPEAL